MRARTIELEQAERRTVTKSLRDRRLKLLEVAGDTIVAERTRANATAELRSIGTALGKLK